MSIFKCKCCEVLKSENAYLRSKLDLLLGVADTRPEEGTQIPGALPLSGDGKSSDPAVKPTKRQNFEDKDVIVFGEG